MFEALHNIIINCDHIVWFYLNTQWHNDLLDTIMPFLRNQWFWAPLYLFLLIFMPSRFGKKGWLWCGAFLITFAIADQVSASMMKPFFNRIRPCNDPTFADIVHIIVPCGGGKSFPSSHAANHFSLAVFGIMSLKHLARWVWIPAILWAAVVSYAQVYVGVHYPLDVVCGGLLGTAIGWATGKVFNKQCKLA